MSPMDFILVAFLPLVLTSLALLLVRPWRSPKWKWLTPVLLGLPFVPSYLFLFGDQLNRISSSGDFYIFAIPLATLLGATLDALPRKRWLQLPIALLTVGISAWWMLRLKPGLDLPAVWAVGVGAIGAGVWWALDTVRLRGFSMTLLTVLVMQGLLLAAWRLAGSASATGAFMAGILAWAAVGLLLVSLTRRTSTLTPGSLLLLIAAGAMFAADGILFNAVKNFQLWPVLVIGLTPLLLAAIHIPKILHARDRLVSVTMGLLCTAIMAGAFGWQAYRYAFPTVDPAKKAAPNPYDSL
jgi:hypothetical protein